MTSYAQNHEDVLLARLFPKGLTGLYVDVGASYPIANSVTKHFYDLGWRGVNVEPAAHPFAQLAEARPRDVNLNIGLSDAPGSLTLFEFPPELSAASTFSAEQAAWHGDNGLPSVERTVEVSTLARVCAQQVGDTPIEFMSIDVEGHERQVIAGGDWTRWRPRVVLVEATQPATTIPTHDEWEGLLLDADYAFATFDGLNRYYVRTEDRALLPALATPVNVTDDYVPYEYLKPLQDLRLGLEATQRRLAAVLAINESLAAEAANLPEELSALRARFERVDRALANLRSRYDVLEHHLATEREPYAELLGDVGPLGLAIARKVSHVSQRFPGASEGAKSALRRARKATSLLGPGSG